MKYNWELSVAIIAMLFLQHPQIWLNIILNHKVRQKFYALHNTFAVYMSLVTLYKIKQTEM